MVTRRGEICWTDLGQAVGSRPAKKRPVLIVQADSYNDSRLATVVAVVVTSNTALAVMPGNVFLPAAVTGLPKDCVANVTAVVTLNKADLDRACGEVPESLLSDVARGLRRVLDL
ncbi:MAG: type II toxin-antitoxin system PemK/MazF family toxin [Actinomycetota bacterium]|nr:type II toxin-antitoxin system PemK/MazF family toxin [Actinomycetota bacterium]